MKKRTSLFIILLCFALFSAAQSYVGVFCGMNSSKLNGDTPEDATYKSRWGINTGVNLDIKLSKSIWISLQPSLSQEGTRVFYKVPYLKEPVDSIHIRLNYISLPLLLKVSANNERWYALAGFETAMLQNSSVQSHGEDVDNDLSVVDWNFAVHFGAGLRIPIGFPRLFLELRYTQGLVNLTDEPVDKSYIPRVKTGGFKFLAGIEFPISKPKN